MIDEDIRHTQFVEIKCHPTPNPHPDPEHLEALILVSFITHIKESN